ncbi:Hypothetical predicted protein [Olea europaea subsp. europaea]|uniref:Uncharacterized protein n=1 Tax=Olea europaea subsp. europaea TaxID=158383 RepID=A0A8S0TN62_OLEEU|nr:Hypothetical predicted protein [Olea europaea subsp. europaea]
MGALTCRNIIIRSFEQRKGLYDKSRPIFTGAMLTIVFNLGTEVNLVEFEAMDEEEDTEVEDDSAGVEFAVE